ncbi:bifunctional folylpolyglutamate synthase/dihydrofolate synthase [Ancylobacter sp. Lp-2]|uniref:bifunctional folylpolyglutamate synthase/dihydrofolate synthase n=1 Tax=Ancylobacter sp. Lp-2 TaxID=2881339 RepID=UPI001E2CECBF|nr:bifunctional folylpolyglutamate synthase/dihydrofolate synthase [Ancylobacter sp. Lp-2]
MPALPAAGDGASPPIDAIFERLLALHPKLIDLSLDRMERLMARLGHPERRLPPLIHVAGTNGKGSTVAFMRAILEAAGKRVHVYTSPHLVRFNERIRLAGRLVEDARLVDALDRAEKANGGEPITFFEITTAAAFLLFAEVEADVLLLEVGLGGRLDATNVVESALVSVITPVSIDHVDFLGETVAAIAGEKAGILKPGVPAVIGRQNEAALRVIERQAARMRAPLTIMGEQFQAHDEGGRLIVADEHGLFDLPRPRLVGPHQIENAGLAVEALRVAGLAVPSLALPPLAFEEGVRAAEWPARLQRLGPGPLTAHAPEGVDVWLDGGHNAAGGQALAAALADIEDRVPRPLVLIVGMLGTKDSGAFLAPFAGLARELIAVPVPGDHKGRTPEEVAAAGAAHGISSSTAPSVVAALDGLAAFPVAPAPRVLIAGSLYLAGAVLGENGNLPE